MMDFTYQLLYIIFQSYLRFSFCTMPQCVIDLYILRSTLNYVFDMEINIGNCCGVIACGAWRLLSWLSLVELGNCSLVPICMIIHDFDDLDDNTNSRTNTCVKMLDIYV